MTDKPTLTFGGGDYSCVTCGLGMKEPCEHWKEMLANPVTEEEDTETAPKLYTQSQVDTLLQAANEAALREAIAKFREYADTKTTDGMKIGDAKKQGQYELMMAGQCLAYATAAKHLESLIPEPSALARHDEKLKAEFAAVMEKTADSLSDEAHKYYVVTKTSEGDAFEEAANNLRFSIPTSYASALDRRLAEERLSQHEKDHGCGNNPHVRCSVNAELRRAVKGESNA